MRDIMPSAASGIYDGPSEPLLGLAEHPNDNLPISDPWFDKRDLPGMTAPQPTQQIPNGSWLPTVSCPDQIQMIDGSIVCAIWCARGDGHPEATDDTERTCRSPQIRYIPEQGGGRTGHHRPAGCRCGPAGDCPPVGWADSTVSISAQQFPDEPPAIVLATEVAGIEQHVTLAIEETDQLAADLITLGMRIEGQRD